MKNYWLDRLKKPSGFPQDDELSLHQGCETANLDMYYPYQFVWSETLTVKRVDDKITTFWPVKHQPVVRSTMTGVIRLNACLNEMAIQKFHERDGNLIFGELVKLDELGPNPVKVIAGQLLDNDELILYWDGKVTKFQCVISYEYVYGIKP